jgi:hypothetical protein
MPEFIHLNPLAPILCKGLCCQEDAYRHVLGMVQLVLDTQEIEELFWIQVLKVHCRMIIFNKRESSRTHHGVQFTGGQLTGGEICIPIGAAKLYLTVGLPGSIRVICP